MSDTKEIEISFEQLEELKKQCKEKIALAEALYRLTKHEDFVNVFIKEYVEKEPTRLVKLLGDSSINMGGKKDEQRNDIHERMIGVARFAEFMRIIEIIAQQAEKTLTSINQSQSDEI